DRSTRQHWRCRGPRRCRRCQSVRCWRLWTCFTGASTRARSGSTSSSLPRSSCSTDSPTARRRHATRTRLVRDATSPRLGTTTADVDDRCSITAGRLRGMTPPRPPRGANPKAEADVTERQRVCWSTVAGLGAIHVADVAGLVRAITHRVMPTLMLGAAMYTLCGLSITAGYHRLFAHRTYRATPPVRWTFLMF